MAVKSVIDASGILVLWLVLMLEENVYIYIGISIDYKQRSNIFDMTYTLWLALQIFSFGAYAVSKLYLSLFSIPLSKLKTMIKSEGLRVNIQRRVETVHFGPITGVIKHLLYSGTI